jgi:hypothetical protein
MAASFDRSRLILGLAEKKAMMQGNPKRLQQKLVTALATR